MIRKHIITGTIQIVFFVSVVLLNGCTGGAKEITYNTTPVTKGSVEQTISSTGSLNPVSSIEIGTQVSGTIVKVYVDYNDTVKKGQVIAEIDKQPLLSKLSQVRASYSRAEALFEQAKAEYERNKPLHEKGLISDEEFSSFKTNYLSQKASLEGAKADVETAVTNVKYATIYSPVNGTVIEKSVEVGQTVAASLSAPILFIVAEDLSKMQILADVDESDIGKIKTGQSVKFSVPAFPEDTFAGTVRQIRLQPTTEQNVVTYTVVIEASNPGGKLLPGMTANVDFIAEKVDDVLVVPSGALRFKPSEDVLQKLQKERQNRIRQDRNEGTGGNRRNQGNYGGDNFAGGFNTTNLKNESRGTVWILTDKNEIHPAFVRIGASNGTVTAISGRTINDGDMVIVSSVSKQKEVKTTKNLFGPSGPPRR